MKGLGAKVPFLVLRPSSQDQNGLSDKNFQSRSYKSILFLLGHLNLTLVQLQKGLFEALRFK